MNLKVRKHTFLYAILFPIVWVGAKLFYRKFRVIGKENFPKDGPVIVVSNHQNGLMDPVMCCLSAPRQLHFLTRADVFKKPLVAKILFKLNMMPVYRPHDRVPDMAERNEYIFNHCVDRLKKGAAVALFPEGNHGNEYFIRPMKKGLSRMVYRSIEKHPELKSIKIVPMGIHYSDYEDFRADFTVRIGEPIELEQWLEAHPESPQNHNALMEKVKQGLTSVTWNLAPYNYYDFFYTYAYTLQNKGVAWEVIKEDIDNYPLIIDSWKEEDLITSWAHYTATISHHHLPWKDFAAGKKYRWFDYIKMVILAPLAWFGFFLFAPPCLITSRMVKNKIKDPHFTSSFKMVFGILLVPLTLLIWSILVLVIFNWKWLLVFLFASAMCGIIALKYFDWLEEIRGDKRRLQSQQANPSLYQEWHRWTESMHNAIRKAKQAASQN